MPRPWLAAWILAAAWPALGGCDTARPSRPAAAEAPFDHVIVIFLENRSFDHLWGSYPGANGLGRPGARVLQTNLDGRPYEALPPVLKGWGRPEIDPRFPSALPNAPFALDPFVPLGDHTPDPVHRYYHHLLQINGGKMDRFVAWSSAGTGGLTMGHWESSALPLYRYARRYVLADNYFTAALGGSWLNHMWLVCACTAVFPGAPESIRARPEVDAAGRIVGLARDGGVTPDGFAVNDLQPFARPHKAGTPDAERVPPQTFPTIGDRLSAAGIDWAWYAGGWNNAVAGRPDPLFEFHHHPFVYFAAYAEATAARAAHLKDEADFLRSLGDDTLPAVSYIKPIGEMDSHAGYSTELAGEAHAVELIRAVESSPYWKRTAIIVTYDDYGGWYDHVPPRLADRWGPGGRVPALIVSPWARRGAIDSTLYDHTSILKLIEWRWNLAPLAARDAAASDMTAAFDFTQTP
ncbi:MAG TPA: alkaline phosphatase family protein [Candidatus Methylomirabilis sp.]|nr:alkaline phosphatase family protein [Candidatus Methylomirabilis sp.]